MIISISYQQACNYGRNKRNNIFISEPIVLLIISSYRVCLKYFENQIGQLILMYCHIQRNILNQTEVITTLQILNMLNIQLSLPIIILILAPSVYSYSRPVALQPDSSYQTGVQIILTSTYANTTENVYSIPYTSAMLTTSLNASLGIYGTNFQMISGAFGWKMYVASITNSHLHIHIAVASALSSISYLKICYIISSSTDFDMSYQEYTFNSTIDSIANYTINSSSGFCFMNCRVYSTVQPYMNKMNPVVRTFLSGFQVLSMGEGNQTVFGLSLDPSNADFSSFVMNIYAYGSANLGRVSFFYLSYDSTALNVLYQRTGMSGRGSLGCWYTSNRCNGSSISNTTFNTGITSVLAYTQSMYFMGLDNMIVDYSGNSTSRGQFDIVGLSQNTDTTIKVDFAFSGNNLGYFHAKYSYFTLQSFYCQPAGPDKYFIYNDNYCDSSCTSLSHYVNSTNICKPCSSTCYQCIGLSTLCTACYNSQNRQLYGNLCSCEVGFYEDGNSICPQCHYSCRSCSGPTSGNCLTCDTSANRYQLNNSCPCIAGYSDPNAKICVVCHYSCQTATCTGTASNRCASCNPAKNRATLLSDFTCPCATGYYDNGSSQQCAACRYSCKTCSSFAVCTSCDINNKRSLSSSVCNCVSGYYDINGVGLCGTCHATCLTCSGGLSTNCLTCDGSLHRQISVTSCVCASYFFELSNVCNACHYSCLTCVNIASTSCTSCLVTSFRTYNATSHQCYCNFGYVDMGTLVCQACSSSCLSCINNTISCTQCHNNPGRYQAGSSCLCQSNYVDLTFNGACTLCHYSCLTCSSASSSGCLSCSNNRTLTSGVCKCPIGYYDNGYSAVCDLCHINCYTCSNGASSGCTTCRSIDFRTLSPSPLGTCICQGGYYEIGAIACAACDYRCLTCSGSSIVCTSCDAITNHRVITSSFTCVCASGYYEVNAAVCPPCIASCNTCSVVSNNCTSCIAARYLLSSSCYCNAGTFQNSTGLCQACSVSCLTCVNSSSTCLTCPGNANRYQLGTTCPCLSGYYDNAVTLCPACNITCLNCSSLFACLSCPPNSYRALQMNGLCTCNAGYYDNGNAVCVKCSPYCLTCSTYSQCLSCNASDNRAWSSTSLTCPCQNGYYDNSVNPTCSACHYSCSTCFGGLSTNCYTCPTLRLFTIPNSCPCVTGYYESANVCTACDIACRTCSVIASNCTSCPSSSYLSNYQCICLQGYFLNGANCSQCNVTCKACITTQTNCQSCNPLHGTTLNGSNCVCSTNQYQNSSTYICINCSSYCLTCTSNTKNSCLSCYSYMQRQLSPNKTCDCIAGYYDSGALICPPCTSPCATCLGGTTLNCTACISGYRLVGSSCVFISVCSNYYWDGVCVNTCPNTTFAGVNVCNPCINNCLTCVSNSVCTTCKLSYYLSNGTCDLVCPGGTYQNADSRQCAPCPTQCSKCVVRNSTIRCLGCITNYTLQDYNCINTCGVASFTHVIVNGICKSCLAQCATCVNLTGCLTCSSAYIFHQGMCLSKCPQGFYALGTSCLPCPLNCSTCTTLGCLTCINGYYVTPSYQCIQIGYFINNQNSTAKCHPNCLTCTNSSFSSCILCASYRGDSSGKAISGYCDCWKGSIDLGNGTCDTESYKSIEKANEALVSATTSLNYLSALTGIIAVNYFAPIMLGSYQQLYSNFYYLNSSSVLQTDQVLNKYGDMCFNKLMQKQTNKQTKKQSKAFSRRLQATTQQQQSLFMRGYSWKYLIEWALYTFLCILIVWILIWILNQIINTTKSCLEKQSLTGRILKGSVTMLKENTLIIIHMLTINDVSFYSMASFKLINKVNLAKDYLKLIFSVILLAYYLLYLIRLFVVGIRFVVSEQQQKQFAILFSCFYSQKKKLKLCRMYVPMMMLRSVAISFALVFLAYNPIAQSVTSLLIFILFTIYSVVYCPYYLYLRVFVHIFEGLFILQILILTISVAQPDASKVGPALALIVFNFLQLVGFLCLIVCIILNKIYNIKCWEVKQKRIIPFRKQENAQQAHKPVYRQRSSAKMVDHTTQEIIAIDEYQNEKIDGELLNQICQIKPNLRRRGNGKPQQQQIKPLRRRKQISTEDSFNIDIFSLQQLEDSSYYTQTVELRKRRKPQTSHEQNNE